MAENTKSWIGKKATCPNCAHAFTLDSSNKVKETKSPYPKNQDLYEFNCPECEWPIVYNDSDFRKNART